MKGLLLVNTGSPVSPCPRDVRAFVEAMLSDPLVMTVPNWFRPILVKGIIGPFRQFSSSKKYKMIWNEEQGKSSLLYHAEQLACKFEEQTGIATEIGMVYLNPSIEEGFEKLSKRCEELSEVIVLPLFPHYAESSYLAAVHAIQQCYKRKEYTFQLRVVEPYFNHDAYIKALVYSIRPYINGQEYERFIFNFHSLPLSHVEKGFKDGKEFDYVYQAKETVRLLEDELNLISTKVRIVYSSAFGEKWLEPSLKDQVRSMGENGIKRVLVMSPGFAADNLETLYDIDTEAREIFLQHGGEEFTYVPCLNSEQYWVNAVRQIVL